MKKITLLLFLLCPFLSIKAQKYQWNAVPGIGGIDLSKCDIFDMTEDTLHGLLIIHGDFDSAGGIYSPHFATYDGNSFVPNPYGYPFSKFNDIIMYHNQLVACTDKAVVLYDSLLQKWGIIGTIGGNYINCLGIYKGELIIGGLFSSINGKAANSIARWDGTTWRSLAPGILGNVYVVHNVQEYHGILYVGGNFDNGGNVGAWNIVSWDGAQWKKVGCYGTGLKGHTYGGDVFSLTIYQDKLYIAGRFDTICGMKTFLAYWNDTSWNITTYKFKEIDQMVSNKDSIYLVHAYAPAIYSWNGISSFEVDSGFNGPLRLCFFKDVLYAGGTFDSSGQTPCYRLARLERDTTYTVSNEMLTKQNVQAFPNPADEEVTIQGLTNYETIEIRDVWGRLVKYQQDSGGQPEINVSDLNTGLYFITINSEKEIITRKIFKR